jgi:hypothetical protein
MRRPYSYVVVQYVPDAGAGESLNVGVIIYSQPERFLQLKVDTRYERLSQAFADFDGLTYRRAMVNLRQVFQDAQQQLSDAPLFEGDRDFGEWLRHLLPDLGASIATTDIRHGITVDLERETALLFERMVESRKAEVEERPRRDDADVWRQCETHLVSDIKAQLKSKAFTTKSVKVTFEHAVKNGRWHAIQPVSMDFKRPESMQRKASQWVGTAIGLQDDPDFGSITFVIGKPARVHSQALERALTLLRHLRDRGEIIEENDAERLNKHIQALLSGTH